MTMYPVIRFDREVPTIYVVRGQTLTCYLNYGDAGFHHQVELRVNPDGACEIFAPLEVKISDFDHDYGMPEYGKGSTR